MSSPADEHRRIAGAFTTTVEGTAPDSWSRPAPVEGWVARDVVRHLVDWFEEGDPRVQFWDDVVSQFPLP